MKARSRYGCLAAMFVVGLLLAIGAWSAGGDEDNQVGVAVALLGVFVLVCFYAAGGADRLVRKLTGKFGMAKTRILFLCTGNSCRSQMAEGFARELKRDVIEAYSAGVEPHGMNPLAVKVMSEAGVDISGQRSKHVDELKYVPFDYVITVCDHANETCPVFPGNAKRIHVGFDDPPRLAKRAKSEQEALPYYRRVRDEIRRFVERLPEGLPNMTQVD